MDYQGHESHEDMHTAPPYQSNIPEPISNSYGGEKTNLGELYMDNMPTAPYEGSFEVQPSVINEQPLQMGVQPDSTYNVPPMQPTIYTQTPAYNPTAATTSPATTQQPMMYSSAVTVVPGAVYSLENIKCLHCNNMVVPIQEENFSDCACAWCCAFFCFTGVLCAILPFLVDGMKDITFKCPNCGNVMWKQEHASRKSANIAFSVLLIFGIAVIIIICAILRSAAAGAAQTSYNG